MAEKVRQLREEFESAVGGVSDAAALQALHDRFLGRKAGALTALLKTLGTLPPDERRQVGSDLNALKAEIEARLDEAKAQVGSRTRDEKLVRERVDITLPGRPPRQGRRHPLTAVREQLESIFV